MQQDKSFGLWLRQRRNTLDLTQWELAERVGCSRDMIQKLESGSRRPSKQVAELLASSLGVSPADRTAFIGWARLGTAQPSSLLPQATQVPARSGARLLESPPPVHLPNPLTSLIGREHDVGTVCDLLLRDDVRLLSLIGPPGVGKTRLGIAVARFVARAFEDGVHFIPVETVTDPSQVPVQIADSLDITPIPSQSALEAVKQHLGDRHILLVMDNFEQVLDAGIQVLELLQVCPAVKVLVTSREALHVYGEWRFAVPPLKMPSAGRVPHMTLDALSREPAVKLFVQRAQAVKSDFGLTRGNAVVITAICARLDGLPLAIELAATRVTLLSLDKILSSLSSRLKLESDLRNLPPRQRTLRGAIDWSFHLLKPSERVLFRRMGVFVGGCTLASAGAVCGDLDSAQSADSPHVLEGLQSLIEKSLLEYRAEEETGKDREGRYALYEMLREYAIDQLRLSGEEPEIRRRHAEHYLALVEDVYPKLKGPEQAQWLQQLEAENDNFRAALAWAIEGGVETVEMGLRLAGPMAKFWDRRGYLSEGRHWLDLALENYFKRAGQAGPSPSGSPFAPISPAIPLKALIAAANINHALGDFVSSRSLYRQALNIAQAANHQAAISICLHNLAGDAVDMGEYAEALDLYGQALALFREQGDKDKIAWTLYNMGMTLRAQGDYASARTLGEESLALRKELGDQFGIAQIMGDLGEIAFHQGDWHQARDLLQASLSIRKEIGEERGAAYCLMWLANLESAEHHSHEAWVLYGESLALYGKVSDKQGLASCLEYVAEACIPSGQIERGVRLWGTAEVLRQTMQAPIPLASRSRHAQAVGQAHWELGEQAFARAWAEGRSMTMEQAIASVLADS